VATIASVLKDQLRIYDDKLQKLHETIDWAYSEIGKTQAARLKLSELMEEALGPDADPPTQVVVQKMAFVDPRIEEARQIGHAEAGAPAEIEPARAEEIKRAATKARIKTRHTQPKRLRRHGEGWTEKILAHLRDVDEPVTLQEIAHFHGVRDREARGRLRAALGRLKQQGIIANPPGEPQGPGRTASYIFPDRVNGAHP
jgi:hypothetical protein